VRSMREFAHPDGTEMSSLDLNRAIESTLVIACNEYKYVADAVTELGELPAVLCYPGELNQALLNIVVNAAQAIGEVVAGTMQRGRITIVTRRDGEDAVVAISDTGGGIPDAVRSRIFDPFFTTKPVGKGTGQGLAIARSVVHEKHGGTLTVESRPGHGTTFTIRIPVAGRRSRPEVAA
jgi:two-component system, NtrC family, sensor kinase